MCLSGGIDSSTVVAMMKKNSSVPIRTFSIGFEEEGYNEANHARLVARHLQTSHTEHIVTAKQAMEVVPSLPEIYDEPFADSSQIPTFLLAQLTRKQVTVALSGDGGDELFGGYNRYLYGPGLWKRSSQYPLWMRAIPGKALLGLQPNVVRCALRILSLLYPRLQSVPLLDEKIRKLGMGLLAKSEDELYYLLQSSLLKGNFPVHRELPLIDDPVSRQQYLDLSSYLPDDILVKIDRATMAASLESRIPFLSQPIVEFAWTLPLNQKIRDGKGKWILRQLLYRHVPKELVDRPKAGFAVPLHAWLGGALQDWAHGLLQESKFEWVPKIWEEHLSGKRNHAPLLWNVLMLQGWLRNEAKEP